MLYPMKLSSTIMSQTINKGNPTPSLNFQTGIARIDINSTNRSSYQKFMRKEKVHS